MVYVNQDGNIMNGSRPKSVFDTLWDFLDAVVRFFETLSPFSSPSQRSLGGYRTSYDNYDGNGAGNVRGGGNRPPRRWGSNIHGLSSVSDVQPPPSCVGCSGGSCG